MNDGLLDANAKTDPAHYQSQSGMQAIEVIEAFGLDFCRGNAVKYLLRAGKKPGEREAEDLQKAEWFINRRLQQLRELETLTK